MEQAARIQLTGCQVAEDFGSNIIDGSGSFHLQVEFFVPPERKDDPVKLWVELQDLAGVPRARLGSSVQLPAGTSWAELSLPPTELPAGQLSAVVTAEGHDRFRYRHILSISHRPAAGGNPAPAAGESPAPAASSAGPDRVLSPPLQLELPWTIVPGALPRSSEACRIQQVRFKNREDEEPLAFFADEPFVVIVRIDLRGLQLEPLLRFQVLGPRQDLLLGSNSARWDYILYRDRLYIGRMTYEKLNLCPGTYAVGLSLWHSEATPDPVENKHGYYTLQIWPRAWSSPARGWLSQSLSWRELADGDVVPSSGQGKMRLVGPQEQTLPQGSDLILELMPQETAVARAWLEDEQGRQVARACTDPLLGHGAGCFVWRLGTHLPRGRYTFCFAWWDEREDRPLGEVGRRPLELTGEPVPPLECGRPSASTGSAR